MKDRQLQIKEALESMKAAERATDFEGLAGHIAKLRYPELVVTERKADGGEDLTAFRPGVDGKTRRGAISLTGTWEKVRSDAQRQRERGVEADVLVFVTTEPVSNLIVTKWREKFKLEFGNDLEVLGQVELINKLEQPENDWLCVRYLRLEPHEPDLKLLQNLIPALRPYLLRLSEDCQHVTLLGIDPQAGDMTDASAPELAKVYIHLNTTEHLKVPDQGAEQTQEQQKFDPLRGLSGKREPILLPAVAALFDHDRSVFLRTPGSGKSTLFRWNTAVWTLARCSNWSGRCRSWCWGKQATPDRGTNLG